MNEAERGSSFSINFPPDVDDVISPLSNTSISDESNTFSEVIDMANVAQTKLQALHQVRKKGKAQ